MKETISIEDSTVLVANALIASRTSPANALCVAEALVAAEVDGQAGHGLSRVPSYAVQSQSGKVDGQATPGFERLAPGFLRVDARNGFAYPALDLAIDLASETAGAQGIAAVGIVNSHHAGQAGCTVERLAARGCVALMFANTPRAMAPWGGTAPLFGTNPIAFAAPRREDVPVVIDLSLSKVARGKIMAAKQRGETIPEGWALDAQGAPTTDPDAALGGAMLPMGDAKGAALALMVELLAASLIGAKHSFEAASFFDAEGDPPGVGQFLLAIDIRATVGEDCLDRIEALCTAIAAQEGARLPGSGRAERRARAARQGLEIRLDLLEQIRVIAG